MTPLTDTRLPVVMVGTAFQTMGGISAVVNAYRAAGLFEKWPIEYVASHTDGSKLYKLSIFFRALARFTHLLVSGKLGILHVHSASDASFWRKAVFMSIALLKGRPIVFHLHGGGFSEFYQQLGSLRKSVVRALLERSSCVICLSAGWATTLRGISPRARIIVIPNPVPTLRNLGVGAPSSVFKKVIFLGKIHQEKGVFDLLRAFGEVARDIPDAELVIAGNGDVSAVLAQAASLGIARRVTCPGWVEGAAKERLLNQGGILALPSYVEGLPMVLLEAMAARMPVVASRVGAIPEVVQHERDALLIEPGDVSGLATALRRLLTDQTLCRRLTTSSSAIIQKDYVASKIVAELERLYQSLSTGAPLGSGS
jgi:glycosyltransferase involved in cell wall biosynthesis